MKFSELEIPESDPFANDQLNRKAIAELLTSVIINQESSFVLGLNSEWGTGKTTFVKMWQRQLERAGYRCIYYNAWENDFSEDSFVSFVSLIKSVLKPERQEEFVNRAKGVAKLIIKRGIPFLVKVATHGVIDTSEIDIDDFGDSVEDLAKGIAEDAIKDYENTKESISRFRDTLERIVGEEDKKKLIIFVDELDRCHPLYAVTLLERIKHIFNIEGLTFVLSIDRSQLSTSIKTLYGSQTNSDAYLKRIINLDFALPPPTGEQYLEYCLQKSGILEKAARFHIESRDIYISLRTSIRVWSLSLREVEHLLISIQTVFDSCLNLKKGFPYYFPYFSLLLAMKIKNCDLYESHIQTNKDTDEIIRKLKGLRGDYREEVIVPILSGLVFFADSSTTSFDQQFSQFVSSFEMFQVNADSLKSHLQRWLFRRGDYNIRTDTDRIIKMYSLFS